MTIESKVMQELHAIREQIYEETKHMTAAERAEHTQRAASAVAKEFGITITDTMPNGLRRRQIFTTKK